MKYLLLKLAEEAGEVVVAAIKHRIHGTAATRDELERECGDVVAMIRHLCEVKGFSHMRIEQHCKARYAREAKRIKNA